MKKKRSRPQNKGRRNYIRYNHRIRAREVLVIDYDGKPLGKMPTQKALELAKQRGLDLVEVASKARPPVCKILEYGKYRYEMSKKERDSKKSASSQKVKELKYHVNISEHDYETKVRNAEKFLMKGLKCKMLIVFRGRENIYKDLGRELMDRIIKDLQSCSAPDAPAKQVGRNLTLMLSPLPESKRERHWTAEDDVDDDEFDDDDDEEGIDDEDAEEQDDDSDFDDEDGEDGEDELDK